MNIKSLFLALTLCAASPSLLFPAERPLPAEQLRKSLEQLRNSMDGLKSKLGEFSHNLERLKMGLRDGNPGDSQPFSPPPPPPPPPSGLFAQPSSVKSTFSRPTTDTPASEQRANHLAAITAGSQHLKHTTQTVKEPRHDDAHLAAIRDAKLHGSSVTKEDLYSNWMRSRASIVNPAIKQNELMDICSNPQTFQTAIETLAMDLTSIDLEEARSYFQQEAAKIEATPQQKTTAKIVGNPQAKLRKSNQLPKLFEEWKKKNSKSLDIVRTLETMCKTEKTFKTKIESLIPQPDQATFNYIAAKEFFESQLAKIIAREREKEIKTKANQALIAWIDRENISDENLATEIKTITTSPDAFMEKIKLEDAKACSEYMNVFKIFGETLQGTPQEVKQRIAMLRAEIKKAASNIGAALARAIGAKRKGMLEDDTDKEDDWEEGSNDDDDDATPASPASTPTPTVVPQVAVVLAAQQQYADLLKQQEEKTHRDTEAAQRAKAEEERLAQLAKEEAKQKEAKRKEEAERLEAQRKGDEAARLAADQAILAKQQEEAARQAEQAATTKAEEAARAQKAAEEDQARLVKQRKEEAARLEVAARQAEAEQAAKAKAEEAARDQEKEEQLKKGAALQAAPASLSSGSQPAAQEPAVATHLAAKDLAPAELVASFLRKINNKEEAKKITESELKILFAKITISQAIEIYSDKTFSKAKLAGKLFGKLFTEIVNLNEKIHKNDLLSQNSETIKTTLSGFYKKDPKDWKAVIQYLTAIKASKAKLDFLTTTHDAWLTTQ